MRRAAAPALAFAALALAAPVASAATGTGGASPASIAVGTTTTTVPHARPGKATLVDGVARAPRGAPAAVRRIIAGGNHLQTFRYRYGGGHRSFTDTAYDCSGSVSFALHAGGLLSAPLDSTSFESWGRRGKGRWVTVYTNPDHAFMIVAGLRLDTSGTHGTGPRWQAVPRSTAGFLARHPARL
jgi:hypothetical protein